MTSSKRNGTDRNYDVQTYKPFDPMCEPGLVSILFLSCGKHKLTRVCLKSTELALKNYSKEIEWLFLEQGIDSDAEHNLELYNSFDTERKIILRPNDNYGINNGFNSLWGVSRGEYCMIHENDFFNNNINFNFLEHSRQILDEFNDIAIVQLRAIRDPNENWGYRKPEYSPWSCGYSKFSRARTSGGHNFIFARSFYGFTNNPILMRKSLYKKCGVYPESEYTSDPRYGEKEYQERVANSGDYIAHINRDIYLHAGGCVRRGFERLPLNAI